MVLHKMLGFVILTDYSISTFVTADKNALFVNIVNILELDIIPDDVDEKINKVKVEQFCVLRCLSLSIDTCDKLHLNF